MPANVSVPGTTKSTLVFVATSHGVNDTEYTSFSSRSARVICFTSVAVAYVMCSASTFIRVMSPAAVASSLASHLPCEHVAPPQVRQSRSHAPQ